MGELLGDRALLLGGSMAALLTARVLADHYKEVVLVDRDELTGVAEPRRSVPQGRHAHGLLGKGQQIFERQFPGLQAEMRTAGVTPGDVNADIRWYFNGRRLKPGRSGLVSIPATRPVLEYHLRGRVQAIDAVRLRDRTDIIGLTSTADGTRITGARVRARDSDTEEVIEADLVVDATGRGSRTPAWLHELGYDRPEEDRVKIGLAYTTRHYRLNSDPLGSDIAIIPVATPAMPRGAFFYRLPGDGNRIELSLTGILGDHPPTDPDGFLEFVKSLPVRTVYEAIRDAEPIDDPVTHQFPASMRRRYDKLPRFPENYLVIGDAVCSFNPVYGQGMTAAALESLTLQRHLANGAVPAAADYFRDIARDIAAPWDVSAASDLGYAGVEGRRTPRIRLVNAYLGRLQRAAVHDAALTNAFLRTAALVDPPQRLFRPNTMFKVLRRLPARPPAGVSAPLAAQPGR
ncbi:NAD(P)/FAD-dependent oxidoreductase [Micromonospora sp. NBC_01813]|uniref:NAD(P)/FAD-dependent oxidoreductase n=1 Tax=Micromonospora sp. NBC_01813 TaxID=2975988 RepID=UPI002DDBB146|nr:FAD-dependent monooxygenase [Micromonospora sp. NBC_01813]WSA08759.1 FAD-dependent monooxygenase [Micromonospora sp. NBC_01813]